VDARQARIIAVIVFIAAPRFCAFDAGGAERVPGNSWNLRRGGRVEGPE
jgi:hypothetical protein